MTIATDDLAAAAAAQQSDHEAYRQAPYPAALHVQATPDRLAVMARLAGMHPAAIETARVLDIGTGNGLHLLALAAAYPDARFVGLDIVEDAIEQGRRWAAKAGLLNVEMRVGDLLNPAAVEGEFDYITAHGVFAWVPPAVADALLALIGRHLAPQGVAMISYNALPGCYLRMAMRDRMLAAAGDETDPAKRLALGRQSLEKLAEPRDNDRPTKAAFAFHARDTLERDDHVLLHDEMGGNFHPRYRIDAIRQAAGHGLAFLGDAHSGSLTDGFLKRGADLDGDHEAQVLAAADETDWTDIHVFHNTLFVRAEARPQRTLNIDVVRSLHVTTRMRETEPGDFTDGHNGVRAGDETLRQVMRQLIAEAPRRVRVADLALDETHLTALFGLFNVGAVTLHTTPEPFSVTPRTPVASPLIRMMIEEGMPWAATLDHQPVDFEPVAKQMILALDGGKDHGRLAAAGATAGMTTPEALAGGIAALARQAVFLP